MLVHLFFTDGYYDYAKILIETFKKHHGEEMPIMLDTRDLSDGQILELEGTYKDLHIVNRKINFKKLSERTGYTIKQLKSYKKDVETYKISPGHNNIVWKQFAAVENRYRNSILQSFEYAKSRGQSHVMNIDADSFILKPIYPIFKTIEENDVSFIFKLERKHTRGRIYGTLTGWKLGKESRNFLKRWRYYIDDIPLRHKPQGYGQTSCFYAYRDLKDSGIKFGKINRRLIHASKKYDELLIRTGNHGRGKTETLKLFKERLNG